jgi:hypothetical protein
MRTISVLSPLEAFNLNVELRAWKIGGSCTNPARTKSSARVLGRHSNFQINEQRSANPLVGTDPTYA